MSEKMIMESASLLAVVRDWANGKFVEKVTGKGLSANDFTDALLSKLNAIESGAEVNEIISVAVNSVPLVIDGNRQVNIDLSNYATKGDIASAYTPKGDIQASGLVSTLLVEANLGDVYNLSDALTITSSNVSLFKNATVGQVYPAGYDVAIIQDGNSYKFNIFGGFIDLSGYYTKGETDTLLGAKANDSDLTSHTGNSDIHVTTSDKSAWNAKYDKPSGGIPKTDLASAVQTSLGKADSAYQKPSGGIPSTDMTSAVQTSLGKADTAYQKPAGGIPSTDLALTWMTDAQAQAILEATS